MDMVMCGNDKCKLKDSCIRFMGVPNEHLQSYMHNPKENCEDEDYVFFIDIEDYKNNITR